LSVLVTAAHTALGDKNHILASLPRVLQNTPGSGKAS